MSTTRFNISVFLSAHLARLSEDADIHIVYGSADAPENAFSGLSLTEHLLPIRRPISPFADAHALFVLWRLFRRERFDLVWTVAPKAGLVGMLAAFLAGVRVRVHVFQGAVWASKRGIARKILVMADWVVASFATRILAVSQSLRDLLESEKIALAAKVHVPASGSICGVDSHRFAPNAESRATVRASLAISDDARVVLFLGRLTVDKGILDLARAWKRVCVTYPSWQLLVVGPDEGGMKQRVRNILLERDGGVHFVEQTDRPEQFIAASDVLCLPSYREGFGLVVIEAAACGVPAIAARVPGLIDALLEGEGGWMHEAGNVEEIEQALLATADEELLQRRGEKARRRALQSFQQSDVVDAYVQILNSWMLCDEAKR